MNGYYSMTYKSNEMLDPIMRADYKVALCLQFKYYPNAKYMYMIA